VRTHQLRDDITGNDEMQEGRSDPWVSVQEIHDFIGSPNGDVSNDARVLGDDLMGDGIAGSGLMDRTKRNVRDHYVVITAMLILRRNLRKFEI